MHPRDVGTIKANKTQASNQRKEFAIWVHAFKAVTQFSPFPQVWFEKIENIFYLVPLPA